MQLLTPLDFSWICLKQVLGLLLLENLCEDELLLITTQIDQAFDAVQITQVGVGETVVIFPAFDGDSFESLLDLRNLFVKVLPWSCAEGSVLVIVRVYLINIAIGFQFVHQISLILFLVIDKLHLF